MPLMVENNPAMAIGNPPCGARSGSGATIRLTRLMICERVCCGRRCHSRRSGWRRGGLRSAFRPLWKSCFRGARCRTGKWLEGRVHRSIPMTNKEKWPQNYSEAGLTKP